ELQAPRGDDLRGHRRERRARSPAFGAEEMRGEIAVAEAEPGVLAIALERVEARERLTGEAPPELLVRGTREGVGDRIEIRAHGEPVELVVVTGVADDDEILGGNGSHEAREEPRGADTTRQAHQHSRRVGDGGRGFSMRQLPRRGPAAGSTGSRS